MFYLLPQAFLTLADSITWSTEMNASTYGLQAH